MTDKLSIAASAAAVVVTGMNVTKGLYNIANICDGAGSEVRAYATETASFSTALSLIRDKMLRPTEITIEEMALVMDLTNICNQILTPLSHIQESLESVLVRHQDNPEELQQICSRISWYFEKNSKLLFYREAMKGQQQNLDALLAAMTYESAKDLMHQMALQNALIAAKGATDRFQGDVARVYSQLGAPAPLLLTGSKQSEGGVTVDDIFGPSGTSSAGSSRHDMPSANNASLPSTNEASESNGGEDLQAMDTMIEESLDPKVTSALDLYEDLRVATRKTTRFAEKISKNTDEGDAPSYSEATGSTPAVRVPVPVPIFQTQSQPPPPAPTATASSSASVSASATGSNGSVIVLQDSLGNYHNLPYEQARSSTGMKALLKQLYSDSGPAVQNWRKDLIKPAQDAIHFSLYVLKDNVTGKEVSGYELRSLKPDRRLTLKFKGGNKCLNMNNEELLQFEADRRKPSGWKTVFK